jgi:hypothetical protein
MSNTQQTGNTSGNANKNSSKKNNENENAKHIPHNYNVGDKLMRHKGSENKYKQPYSGPHSILQVNTNGTACLQIGIVTDLLNICQLDPHKVAPNSIHGGECNMQQSRRKRRTNNT